MRFNILGTVAALLAYPLVSTAAAIINAPAATTAINATSPLPIGRWWELRWDSFAPDEADLGCQLSVIWYDNWGEYGQARYRVYATVDLGRIYETLDLDDAQAQQYEKLFLEAWAYFWFEESKGYNHPGANWQLWFETREKTQKLEGWADASFYKTKEGYREYVGHNVQTTRRWKDWTRGRCSVYKDF